MEAWRCFSEYFLKLFDSQIKLMFLYGSEIWGMQMDLQIEKAHLFALKRLQNVSPKTPNDMVYGETGRTPLHLDAKVSSIRFWLRLMRMTTKESLQHASQCT